MSGRRGFIAGLALLMTFVATMGLAGAQQARPEWRGWQALQAQAEQVVAQAPELQAPELQAPELQAPELQAPELQAPELQAPELQVSQGQTPDDAVPALSPQTGSPAPPPAAPPAAPSQSPPAPNDATVAGSEAPNRVAPLGAADQPRFQPGEYVLGVGDRLRIIVFGEEDLSGEFVVDSTGRVSFPLIGEIPAALSSVSEFQRRVEDALRGGYLNDPRVSAEVMNFRPFYILGEVQRPGEYPFTNGLTVLNAVATAGGFTPLANQTRVFIKPAGEGMEEEIVLSPATPVAPGDTIRIAKGAFYILGEVTRPGEYPFSEGMTVLNAVATAGGFTYRANQGRVFIQREGADREQSFRLEPNLRIEAGDTIRIGERFF
jgi:polysaccharide export outer membrane protein